MLLRLTKNEKWCDTTSVCYNVSFCFGGRAGCMSMLDYITERQISVIPWIKNYIETMPHILIGSSFQKSNCCSSKIWLLSKTVRKGRQSYHHTDVHNVTQTADNVSQPQGYSFSQNITELTTTENETKKPFRKEKHIKTIQSWVKLLKGNLSPNLPLLFLFSFIWRSLTRGKVVY